MLGWEMTAHPTLPEPGAKDEHIPVAVTRSASRLLPLELPGHHCRIRAWQAAAEARQATSLLPAVLGWAGSGGRWGSALPGHVPAGCGSLALGHAGPSQAGLQEHVARWSARG